MRNQKCLFIYAVIIILTIANIACKADKPSPYVVIDDANNLFTVREGAAVFNYQGKDWFVMSYANINFSEQPDSYFTEGNANIFKTIPTSTSHSRISRQLDAELFQSDWITITYDLIPISADDITGTVVIRHDQGATGGNDISNSDFSVFNNDTAYDGAILNLNQGLNQTLSVRRDLFTGGYFALAKAGGNDAASAHLLRITKIDYSSNPRKTDAEEVIIKYSGEDVTDTAMTLFNPGGSVELSASLNPLNADYTAVTYSWVNKGNAVLFKGSKKASSITVNAAKTGSSTVTVSISKNKTIIDTATVTFNVTALPAVNAIVTVDTGTKYQYVRGFGGMDTPWNNVPALTLDDYETMYNPEKLGYTMMRIMILAYNTNHNTTIDSRIDGDRPNYVEGVKIVNKYGGYVLASPWSPPAVWKSNNDIVAGTEENPAVLLPEHYRDYANYLRSFCQIMAERGAPIYAISIQNEPNFIASGYEGCEWTPEEMRDFFKTTGHFTTNPTPVPGWGGGKATPHVLTMNGESANTPDINISALEDPVSRNAIDVLGRHIYGWQMQRNIDQYGKEMWMTEYNFNSGADESHLDVTWDYVWRFINAVDLTIRLNNENAFIWWTAKRWYSMLGDGIHSGTKAGEILPRGHALSHYAKFASNTNRVAVNVTGNTRSGAEITEVNVNHGTFSNTDVNAFENSVKITAFESLDGNSISLIMYTPTFRDGKGGIDMGNIKIQFPADFTIRTATAMRSTSTAKSITENVEIGADKNSINVSLPGANILSIRVEK